MEKESELKVDNLHQNSNIQKDFRLHSKKQQHVFFSYGGGGGGGEFNFLKRLCYIVQNSVRFAPHLNSGDYLHLIGRGQITQHD